MADSPPRQMVTRQTDDKADLGHAERQPVPQYTGLFLEPDIPPQPDDAA